MVVAIVMTHLINLHMFLLIIAIKIRKSRYWSPSLAREKGD